MLELKAESTIAQDLRVSLGLMDLGSKMVHSSEQISSTAPLSFVDFVPHSFDAKPIGVNTNRD